MNFQRGRASRPRVVLLAWSAAASRKPAARFFSAGRVGRATRPGRGKTGVRLTGLRAPGTQPGNSPAARRSYFMHPTEKTHPRYVLSKGSWMGFAWLTAHNNLGYRCGYVRVPKGHPWHGLEYENVPASAHGGFTYAEADTDGGWWVGFDCAHHGDGPDPELKPRVTAFFPSAGRVWSTADVEEECKAICEQAAAVHP